MRYELTDHEWFAIKPLLPNKPRGVPRVDDRRVLNGIFWVLRSGAPWRDLPRSLGPYTTSYNRFVRWRRAGVWSRIMSALATTHDASVQMIDTSIVRVHQHAACIARNRKGKAAVEQSARAIEESYSATVEKMRDYNLKMIDMGSSPFNQRGCASSHPTGRSLKVPSDRQYDQPGCWRKSVTAWPRCSPATRPGASPPTSPSCRSRCGGADNPGKTSGAPRWGA